MIHRSPPPPSKPKEFIPMVEVDSRIARMDGKRAALFVLTCFFVAAGVTVGIFAGIGGLVHLYQSSCSSWVEMVSADDWTPMNKTCPPDATFTTTPAGAPGQFLVECRCPVPAP